MRIIQTIISFFAIAAGFLGSLFSSGTNAMIPFTNEYTVPDSIPAYQTISTDPKTDWQARWIWDGESLNQSNVWMCFRKTVDLDCCPKTLTASVSADSKYWLYINGETVVYEGSVKRGPEPGGGYYDTVDLAPYLKTGENCICALVWYWDQETSYSYHSSGQGGFLFEAIGERIFILSDSSWKVRQNSAYIDSALYQPNYRLSEYSIYYDARKSVGDWTDAGFDDSDWANAAEFDIGGSGGYGRLFPRGIPLLKDGGMKAYENAKQYENYTVQKLFGEKITVDLPYNAQFTPYLHIIAPAGKKIRITTEKTVIGAVSATYLTTEGEQSFEALGWMNGEHATYRIPKGVTIVSLQYHETGYNSDFCGEFQCDDPFLNALWQKSLRTLYVTMRDNFMDCPDRERAQWWGDATSEMLMTMYAMDARSYLLYQKGVQTMLSHTDNSDVLQTVVPITGDSFELPVQQLAGIVGFQTYYQYTGDIDFLKKVYDASYRYLKLWQIGDNGLVIHRSGSWDWADWGKKIDKTAIENAWYYYALSAVKNMANTLGKEEDNTAISKTMELLSEGFQTLWTDAGYQSDDVKTPDDRANALAVLSGLAGPEKYTPIARVLTTAFNSSPYMEYYVLEALCKIRESEAAKRRIYDRYADMMGDDYSTLWEFWDAWRGTKNHAWSGGPLVIMSKYFAGIKPLKPGYEFLLINPKYSLFDRMSCTVPSVKGLIRMNYKKSTQGYQIELNLPQSIKGTCVVPPQATVIVNGAPYYQNDDYVNKDTAPHILILVKPLEYV